MEKTRWIKYVGFALGAGAVFLGIRYILPFAMPFLLGTGLALAAEPVVGFASKSLKLRRGAAAGIGVSVTLVLLLGLILMLCSTLVRELGQLADILPDVEQTARQGLTLLEDFLLGLANRTPSGVRPMLTRSVSNLFGSSSALVDQVSAKLPGIATAILGGVPDGALTAGTAVISAFMISARLPRLRDWLKNRVPSVWKERYLPAAARMRHAIAGWLKAQLKLAGISFLIICVGLLVLQIPYAPVWALLIALVDAIPLLGTAIVLLPWALVSLLQGQQLQALGLVVIYGAASLTRTVLEPRFLGKQLGLDPLMTLAALYLGYRLWGLAGMLLAPIAAVAATQLTAKEA